MCNHNADTCTATRCLPWKILICKCQPRKGRKGTAGCRGDKTGPEREGDERDPPSPGTCVWACARGHVQRVGMGCTCTPCTPPAAQHALCRACTSISAGWTPPLCTRDPPGARGNPPVHVGPSPCTWDPLARVAPSSRPRRRTPWGAAARCGDPPAAPHMCHRAGDGPVPAPTARPRGEAAGRCGFLEAAPPGRSVPAPAKPPAGSAPALPAVPGLRSSPRASSPGGSARLTAWRLFIRRQRQRGAAGGCRRLCPKGKFRSRPPPGCPRSHPASLSAPEPCCGAHPTNGGPKPWGGG